MSINLEHTEEEVGIIIAGLRKLPMEIAEVLVNKIRGQAIPQLQANKPAPAPEVPAGSQVMCIRSQSIS